MHGAWADAPANERWFLLFVPVALAGALVAASLSPDVEAPEAVATRERHRRRHRGWGRRSRRSCASRALFALDSFGGGFVVQAFIAYWLAAALRRVGRTARRRVLRGRRPADGLVPRAPRCWRERFGLLNTMVFTHLPSNVLLAAMAFAPTLPVAIALLLARVALSQMDVPTRQAYVMALVEPEERTAAAAYTNTARYVVRPLGPTLAGAAQTGRARAAVRARRRRSRAPTT